MSTSERDVPINDFGRWIAGRFATSGAFTALVVLVGFGEQQVTPMCSTWFNIVADDMAWREIVVMFAGAGQEWDGAAFFPLSTADGGPVDNPTVRLRLRELEARIDDDLLVFNEGALFDREGRCMQVEKETLQCVPACP